MKCYIKKISAAVLTGTLCFAFLGGCASSDSSTSKNTSQNATGTDAETSKTDMDDAEEDAFPVIPETFRPSDLVIPSQDRYEYPSLGMNFTIPQILLEKMEQKEVAMLSDAAEFDDESLDYGIFSWSFMTKEQLDAEVSSKGNGFYDWADELERIGVLGIYHLEQVENLDTLTKCRAHTELGKSDDGNYANYLSINPDADRELTEAMEQIVLDIVDIVPEEDDNFDIGSGSLGEFSMQDIQGQVYTNEMFKEHELTLVHIFATWCSPCIAEIPDLQKLSEEMAGQGVNVVGIVLDAADSSGNVSDEAVEKAKILADRTGADYPFLIPSEGCFDGRLENIDAVPETFFVDKNGNIVGETYSGSHDLEAWKSIVQTVLDSLKGSGQ